MTTETTPTAARTPARSMMAVPIDAGAELRPRTGPAGDPASDPARRSRILGLRCRNCHRPEAIGPSFVCPACFGPLEVVYDREAIRAQVSRAKIEARSPGIWRYLELLPVEEAPAHGLAVGFTPLLRADRLARDAQHAGGRPAGAAEPLELLGRLHVLAGLLRPPGERVVRPDDRARHGAAGRDHARPQHAPGGASRRGAGRPVLRQVALLVLLPAPAPA